MASSWPPSAQALDKALLQLVSWPQLTRLPSDADCETLARVCALLTCKPTVGFLVPRILDVPSERAQSALEWLHAKGHLRLAGGERSAGPVAEAPNAGVPAPVPPQSMIHRLWRRFAMLAA